MLVIPLVDCVRRVARLALVVEVGPMLQLDRPDLVTLRQLGVLKVDESVLREVSKSVVAGDIPKKTWEAESGGDG